MFKYKNKNLKITLSLVVSTMSIIMANCMDGQGSGSSSSNAPAASGSRSLNTSTIMWHLLQFLNNQNKIEASQSALQNTQSALQNTQSALVGRVNGLELTIIRNQSHLTNQIDAEHVITSIEIADVRRELADVIADVRREFSDSHRGLLDVLKSDKERTEEQLEALQRKVDLMDNGIERLEEKLLLRELELRDQQHERDICILQYRNNKLQQDMDNLLKTCGNRGCLNCNIL